MSSTYDNRKESQNAVCSNPAHDPQSWRKGLTGLLGNRELPELVPAAACCLRAARPTGGSGRVAKK